MTTLHKRIETIHDDVEAIYDDVNEATRANGGKLSNECLSALNACAVWLRIAGVNLGFAADAATRALED